MSAGSAVAVSLGQGWPAGFAVGGLRVAVEAGRGPGQQVKAEQVGGPPEASGRTPTAPYVTAVHGVRRDRKEPHRMSIAMDLLADELVTADITVTYRYPCDQRPTQGPVPDPAPPLRRGSGNGPGARHRRPDRSDRKCQARAPDRHRDLRPAHAQTDTIAARLTATA